MQKKYRIGVDIGGTKTNIGIIGEDGDVLKYTTISSLGHENIDEMVDKIILSINKLFMDLELDFDNIIHFGIGIPGTADTRKGIVIYSPNLFGSNIMLAQKFYEKFKIRPTIVQDSWAGAYCEYLFGNNENLESFVLVTIGTGVGCGVILNGNVFAGQMGSAGEIGHTQVVPNGRLCNCGQRGCLETYSSGTAIFKMAYEKYPEIFNNKENNTATVFKQAYCGNEKAKEIIEYAVDILARGLTIVSNIYSCKTIIVSGGLCVHKELIIDPLSEKINRYGYGGWSINNKVQTLRSSFGDLAPMVGAGFLEDQYIIR